MIDEGRGTKAEARARSVRRAARIPATQLSDLGEFGLIDRIRKLSYRKTSSTVIGIGDDAAALKISPAHCMLVTTDLLLEDVHFDLAYTDYYSLGWKSAAVNLSDIAAMGGAPRFCLTALGIPPKMTGKQVFEFYRGFKKILDAEETILVGGDTCSSRRGFFVSVTAIGEAKPARLVSRSGARPGDHIFVTGTLGDSGAGLEILQAQIAKYGARNRKSKIQKRVSGKQVSGLRSPAHSLHSALIQRHLRPVPRVSEGRSIARSGCATAMIDVSDGLSSDLLHICEESGVGADIIEDRVPLSAELRKISGDKAFGYAVSGGEDYELLFTAPESCVEKVLSLKFAVTEIGVITKGSGLSVIDHEGNRRKLHPGGYDHFRTTRAGTERRPLRRARTNDYL